MFNILLNHLNSNYYDNHVYYGLSNEELEHVKATLEQREYPYTDVIFDFKDLGKLQPLIDSIPKDTEDSFISIKKYVYNVYLISTFMHQVKYSYKGKLGNIHDIERALYDGDINTFKEYFQRSLGFMDMFINYIRIRTTDRIRLHFFFDDLDDNLMQMIVNNLIYSRPLICVMGYTSKDQLKHYLTSNGQIIECPHDYSEFYKEEYFARKRKH